MVIIQESISLANTGRSGAKPSSEESRWCKMDLAQRCDILPGTRKSCKRVLTGRGNTPDSRGVRAESEAASLLGSASKPRQEGGKGYQGATSLSLGL